MSSFRRHAGTQSEGSTVAVADVGDASWRDAACTVRARRATVGTTPRAGRGASATTCGDSTSRSSRPRSRWPAWISLDQFADLAAQARRDAEQLAAEHGQHLARVAVAP